MINESEDIGARLIKARRMRNLSIEELAGLIGVRPATVKGWEAGKSAPRANRLQMLAGILNVPLTWLFGGVDEHAPTAVDPMGNDALEHRLFLAQQLHQQLGDQLAAMASDIAARRQSS